MTMYSRHFLLAVIITLLSGCALEIVHAPITLRGADVAAPPEAQLADIAIVIFTPLVEPGDEPVIGQEPRNLQSLRIAESHYASWLLAQTLERSAQWGAVRLNPFAAVSADVMVSGAILQSDGETMRVQVQAVDASGVVWLDKQYLQVVTASNYGKKFDGAEFDGAESEKVPPFPFQPMITSIANDLLAFREKNISATDIAYIRKVASLRFAANLAPELYGSYLTNADSGQQMMIRLPASNDAIYAEIQNIHDRNRLFLDAIGRQYTVFASQVYEPYRNFLKRSQQITAILNSKFIDENEASGFMSIPSISGDFGNSQGKAATRIYQSNRQSDSLNTGIRRARMYASALAEAGSTFEMDVQPQTVQFAAHTVELSGTLEEQFAEWQQILSEIQRLETAAE